MKRSLIYRKITTERKSQDDQWGGAAHDDHHDGGDWLKFIERQIHQADICEDDDEFRLRLIKIAALAVAAIESLDRKTAG